MNRTTFSIIVLVVSVVYMWWRITPEDAEEGSIVPVFLLALAMFGLEGLFCGFEFFTQRCYGAYLGAGLFAAIFIVLIKRRLK